MRRAIGLAVVAVALVANSRWDPVEQAHIGRREWTNAVASLRAGDSSMALAQLRLAHEAWPAQPVYSEGLVRLAARLGDASTAARTLGLLAAQGLGAAVARDSVVNALAALHPALAQARDSVMRASNGPSRSTIEFVSDDSLFFPEGLSVDSADGTRFVTSLRHRNVWVTAANRDGRWLLPTDISGRGAVFGAKLSHDRRSLWLTLAPTPHMGVHPADSSVRAELWQVNRNTGSVLRRLVLGNGRGIPGELTLHPDGSVLVSDAVLGRLYRLRPSADSMQIIEHPLLRSPQGIAVLGHGRLAIVADWSHGLLRWDLDTDRISAIETPSTMALLGVDGLLMVDGHVIAVQNGVHPNRVMRVGVDSALQRVLWAETIDRPAAHEGEFTVAATDGRSIVYVASSSWPFWDDNARRVPNSGALPPVTLRSFVLPGRGGRRR